MEAAREVRHAVRGTLAEIDPPQLAEELDSLVRTSSMVPGVVTRVTAERLGGRDVVADALDRAVGVQLSYDGLRLTRELIREEGRYAVEDPTDEYLALVAAEVLVSRGFGELATTPVADQAIDIVRRFSRNQTTAYERDQKHHGRSLEYDAVILAVAAGATTVDATIPDHIREYGETLAAELDREPLPPATEVAVPIRTGLDAAVGRVDAVAVND